MASDSFDSSYMELWEGSKIAKPEPLRIFKKRPETIASCSAPGKNIFATRKPSKSCLSAGGSSPEGPNKPLTIRKRRRNRGSILDASFDSSSTENPKLFTIRAVGHDTSQGFRTHRLTEQLCGKSEISKGASENGFETTTSRRLRMSAPSYRDYMNSQDENLPPQSVFNETIGTINASDTAQKRASKGKKLIRKAFTNFSSVRSKSMQLLQSKSSDESLLCLKSLGNNNVTPSSPNSVCQDYSQLSFEPSIGTTSSNIHPKFLAEDESARVTTPFILYPEITVIPEVRYVDMAREATFWVAITVVGHLKTIDPSRDKQLLRHDWDLSTSISDKLSFGQLYDMHIHIIPRSSCVLEDIITESSEPRTLRAGESLLIIAKVRLEEGIKPSSHVRGSSAELFAELEHQLGETVTNYLDVKVTFKHSAFPTYVSSTIATTGMSYYATTIKTEARAVMKRFSSDSNWSSQRYESSDANKSSNPLIPLIEFHYELDKAQEIINKISSKSIALTSICRGQVFLERNWGSSSDTIMPIKKEAEKSPAPHIEILETGTAPASANKSQDLLSMGSDSPDAFHEATRHDNPDPARRIWGEIRKNSRSSSTCQLEPSSTIPSTEISSDFLDLKRTGETRQLKGLTKEQARLLELALKNKRSVGADTLRSMAAPSTQIGLGSGRGWGWGPPWW